MDIILFYFLKVNFAFVILYLFYKSAFTKDTFFNLRRFILLTICVISILYPFVEISSLKINAGNEDLLYNVYNVFIQEVVISDNADPATGTTTSPEWFHLLILLYVSGIIILFFRSILEFRAIYRTIRKSIRKQINGITVHVNTDSQETYSFFKWISLTPEQFSDPELNEILIHEQTHVREWHSLDILFIQLILIFNWFNPFIWLLRSEIRMNHEYLADRKVIISGFNKKNYQYHLVGLGSSNAMAAAKLYNSFSILPLKNRLKMLNKKRTSNIMISKYLMFIPVLGFLLVFSNCTESLTKQDDQKLFGIDANEVVVMARAKGETKSYDATSEENFEGEVYETVEVMPEFANGEQELMQYLSKNIKYPAEAQVAGTQGRVILQFVVDKDGSVNDVTIAKSVDSLLDNEAIRVAELMPKWTPGRHKGKNVQVKYTIPVEFRLQ